MLGERGLVLLHRIGCQNIEVEGSCFIVNVLSVCGC